MILNTKVSHWIRIKTECLVGISYVSGICSTLIGISSLSQVTTSIPQAFLVITTSIHKEEMQKLLLDFIVLWPCI